MQARVFFSVFFSLLVAVAFLTCISLMQARVFCFFAGGSSILNSNQHMWQWKEEAVLCEIHMRDFKSHF